MELMFVGIIGAITGAVGHYALPWRNTHGVALIPAVGAVAAMVIWVALTWAGLAWDGGWIWWYTTIGAAIVVTAVDLAIGRGRARSDAELAARVQKAGVTA